ncbi:hypothetical protein [Thermoanaerobacterium sp. DL9XJH110]|uniref:hypothetical protein n=1 Tax=Thermoanaerobacterium sp. DL9XJH110 TaxID=3386643 RepID=UPI003BB4CB24
MQTKFEMIAAFAGKNRDFRLYLQAMKTWLLWEKVGAKRGKRLKSAVEKLEEAKANEAIEAQTG